MIANRFNPLGVRLGKPYAYEVEYLTCNGRQYINLGLKPDNDYSVNLKIQNAFTGNGRCGVFGVYYGSNSQACFFGFERFSSARFACGWNGFIEILEVEDEVYYAVNDVVLSKTGIVVNGESFLKWFSHTINQGELTMRLGGTAGGWQFSNIVGNIYKFSLEKNGEFLFDLIPVVDWNGVACWHNKATGEFFYNQGTGEFIPGPRI